MENKGFTLLEIIIVIIIVGVLAATALPKLFSVIEGSRAAEVLVAFSTIRSALGTCYLMNNGSYQNCAAGYFSGWIENLGIENPRHNPGANFDYSVITSGQSYCLSAWRKLDVSFEHSQKVIMMGIGYDVEVIGGGRVADCSNRTDDDKMYWDAAEIYKPYVPKGE